MPGCPDHGPEIACEREGYDTDGRGFPHASQLGKRLPARHCHGCPGLVVKGTGGWSIVTIGKVKLLWHPYCAVCLQQKLDDFEYGYEAASPV
jgi:hypothetical protein